MVALAVLVVLVVLKEVKVGQGMEVVVTVRVVAETTACSADNLPR